MTDRETTAPACPVALERDCVARHERVAADLERTHKAVIHHDRQLTILCGIDGQQGRCAAMGKVIDDHELRLRTSERMIAKGMMFAALISAIGSALLSWLFSRI